MLRRTAPYGPDSCPLTPNRPAQKRLDQKLLTEQVEARPMSGKRRWRNAPTRGAMTVPTIENQPGVEDSANAWGSQAAGSRPTSARSFARKSPYAKSASSPKARQIGLPHSWQNLESSSLSLLQARHLSMTTLTGGSAPPPKSTPASSSASLAMPPAIRL